MNGIEIVMAVLVAIVVVGSLVSFVGIILRCRAIQETDPE